MTKLIMIGGKSNEMIVKENQNLDTLMFCFNSLMIIEALVIFGVFTNLTLLLCLRLLCCNIAYPNLFFLNYVLSSYSYHFSFVSFD